MNPKGSAEPKCSKIMERTVSQRPGLSHFKDKLLSSFTPLISQGEKFLNSKKLQVIILIANAIVPLVSFIIAYSTGQLDTSLPLLQLLPFTIIIFPFSLARVLVPSDLVKIDAWRDNRWYTTLPKVILWGMLGVFGIWALSGGIAYLAFNSLKLVGVISTLVTLFFAGAAAFTMSDGLGDVVKNLKAKGNVRRLAAIIPIMLLVFILPLIASFSSMGIAGIVGVIGLSIVLAGQFIIHHSGLEETSPTTLTPTEF